MKGRSSCGRAQISIIQHLQVRPALFSVSTVADTVLGETLQDEILQNEVLAAEPLQAARIEPVSDASTEVAAAVLHTV